MFLCNISKYFNGLQKKLHGYGLVVLTMFENIKTFMTKLHALSKGFESETAKYICMGSLIFIFYEI